MGIKSLDDFLIQGKATGKKFASGRTNCVAGVLTVNNLTFTPSTVLCESYGANIDVCIKSTVPEFSFGTLAIYGTLNTVYAGAPITFNSTGFVVDGFYTGTQTVDWIAYE